VVPCSEGNPLEGSTPTSDQESQEMHSASGHVEKFSRIVISFCMKFCYTSMGWSDD